MKLPSLRPAFFLLLVPAMLAVAQAQEEVLYRNIFSWSATTRDGQLGNGQPHSVAWQQFTGAEGKTGETYSVNAGIGLPTDLDNVNSSATVESKENGFFYPGVKPHSVVLSVLTPEEQGAAGTLDPAQITGLSFRWYGSVQREGVNQRLAIQINNDKWYVTEQTYGKVIGWKPFKDNASQNVVDFSPTGSNWRELVFSPDSELKISEQHLDADLPAGPITNFGIFSENTTEGERLASYFDTFEVVGTKAAAPAKKK